MYYLYVMYVQPGMWAAARISTAPGSAISRRRTLFGTG